MNDIFLVLPLVALAFYVIFNLRKLKKYIKFARKVFEFEDRPESDWGETPDDTIPRFAEKLIFRLLFKDEALFSPDFPFRNEAIGYRKFAIGFVVAPVSAILCFFALYVMH